MTCTHPSSFARRSAACWMKSRGCEWSVPRTPSLLAQPLAQSQGSPPFLTPVVPTEAGHQKHREESNHSAYPGAGEALATKSRGLNSFSPRKNRTACIEACLQDFKSPASDVLFSVERFCHKQGYSHKG